MMKIATIEGKGSGTLLQRAILLLAMATVLVAMVVATAAPAFAVRHREGGAVFACTNGTVIQTVAAAQKQELEKQGYTCTKLGKRI